MLTCGNGIYTRTEDGWRYPWGATVPGASDLVLADLLALQPDIPCVEAIQTVRQLSDDERRWLTGQHRDAPVVLRSRPGRRSDVRDLVICMLAPELHASVMLTVGDVAALAGVSKATVDSYRYRGLLPSPQVVRGRTPLWARPIVRHWIEQRSARPLAATTVSAPGHRAQAPGHRAQQDGNVTSRAG